MQPVCIHTMDPFAEVQRDQFLRVGVSISFAGVTTFCLSTQSLCATAIVT